MSIVSAVTRMLIATLVFLVFTASPQAHVPSATDPDANAVREEQLLHELYRIEGRVHIPDTREGVLIQPTGRGWQAYHEGILRWIGLGINASVIILLALFYFVHGRV